MAEFHFLRPMFLLLIPLTWWIVWRLRQTQGSGPWRQVIAPDRLSLLLEGGARNRPGATLALAGCLTLACAALAGPTWQKLPVPTSSNDSPLVILFDLSPSMLAADLTPDRLTRARLKVADLLRSREDGQTALIAYAGSPHRVSPLTDDARTIESLLPALHPAVMPVAGSQVESAMELALDMLASAGSENRGQLLVVTDGIAPEAQRTLRDQLPVGVQLSILGLGSTEGAPIPVGGGNFLRDNRGEIVLARLNRSELQALAQASGGRYAELQPTDEDIRYLMEGMQQPSSEQTTRQSAEYDDWHDAGYWLLALLIPVALYASRRGVLLSVPLVLCLGLGLLPSQPAHADWWDDLWLTPDQQGQRLLDADQPGLAAEQFESADWSAWANWQAGNYDRSADAYQRAEASDYNLGTALARQGDLEAALPLLEQFVQDNPEHENGRHNLELVQRLLEQQKQQEQQQSQSDESGEGDQSQDPQQGQSGSDQNGEQSGSPEQNTGSGQSGQPQQQESDSGDANQGEEADQQEQSASNSETEQQSPEQTQALPAEQSMAVQDENLSAASEQWLRAIPDDPAGLLRRKFEYERQLYRQQQRFLPPDSSLQEDRY